LPCGHDILETDLNEETASDVIGIPLCPDCSTPVGFHPRLQSLIKRHKDEVAAAYLQEMLCKNNSKKVREQVTELTLKETITAWGLKPPKPEASYQELACLKLKCQLLKLISAHQNETVINRIGKMVANADSIGPSFAKNVLAVISSDTAAGKDMELLSFDFGRWKNCQHCEKTYACSIMLKKPCNMK